MTAMPKKYGVILVNLGTPEVATPLGVRRFLRQFLSDPRVVDLPRWLWWPILNGIILPLRSKRVARAYTSIWTQKGSPLLSISQELCARLEQRMTDSGFPCYIELAMTYGSPSLMEIWEKLNARNVSNILLLPMYPQYSVSTTAPVWDAWGKIMATQTVIPSLQFSASYHDNPHYIKALAESIRCHWQAHGSHHLLFSFHGIPVRYVEKGDPYPTQCEQTASLVAAELGLGDDAWSLSYQSRFGKAPWIQPYTDETLSRLAVMGVKHVDIICPGFAVDCLETLEEIAVDGNALFMANGGEKLHYISALNATEPHIDLFEALIKFNIGTEI